MILAISAYTLTCCYQDSTKDDLQEVCLIDIAVLAGDLNVQVGCLGIKESRLCG